MRQCLGRWCSSYTITCGHLSLVKEKKILFFLPGGSSRNGGYRYEGKEGPHPVISLSIPMALFCLLGDVTCVHADRIQAVRC